MDVFRQIDQMKQKADAEQNAAKKEIESNPGWKFKGWKPSAAHGVVWVAAANRWRVEIERPTVSELVTAVRERVEALKAAEAAHP